MNPKQEMDLTKAFLQKSALYLQEAFEHLEALNYLLENPEKQETPVEQKTVHGVKIVERETIDQDEEMSQNIVDNETIEEQEKPAQQKSFFQKIVQKPKRRFIDAETGEEVEIGQNERLPTRVL